MGSWGEEELTGKRSGRKTWGLVSYGGGAREKKGGEENVVRTEIGAYTTIGTYLTG